MSELKRNEVAEWIRKLVPYLDKPVIIAPEGYFDKEEYEVKEGKIITCGDCLVPTTAWSFLGQTENLKVLVDLYKSLEN